MWHRAIAPLLFSLCAGLCSCDQSIARGGNPQADFSSGGSDGSGGEDLAIALDGDGGSPGTPDGGPIMSCLPNAPDQASCACDMPNATRACYPSGADPATRGKGICKDGMQVCQNGGEFSSYGACTGATLPTKEICNDGLDNNCDGKVDCADPTCATDPACNKGGCTNGATRPCYNGPQGTDGVGICHDGTQICANGKWPANCPGEQLPEKEHCDDAKDHDCNHLPGCLDFFSCLLDPICQPHCMNADNGCTCPMGAGDTALCPDGDIGVSKGLDYECCPCTKNDCGNAGCCAEPVCAGDPQCKGYNCMPLAPSCKGMVNADCDDFPEDCDEPCCKCTNCP